METVNGKALRLKTADYLDIVAREQKPLEVTYRGRPAESVALIPPKLWRNGIAKAPVAQAKIQDASVRDTRARFGDLRNSAVREGVHVRITRNGAEHVVLVPIEWARTVLGL
ncbi:type II toxin-antitoxin system prevent-host-death family antitoxin [Nocardia terpenica]|uniref:Type II toxin-antitoxin system prevent-host-death family antitoxin n=1 Tax=Nocardia terpenica TaxID=455432 RepID=A0A6G9ZDP3_9NOCA|nr:type II toxin-antitoxin system prevent-host-death family antitoxin [Nocardia terpenica]QIS23467.1 type II toxin-antitoxin system prevent-host-death family antitoxin [Nocardia terpenica]